MIKPDKAVKKETLYIFIWQIALSVIMQLCFAFAGAWDIKVVLGNILGIIIMTANFYLMGISVQKALSLDESEAKKVMKLSQMLRMLMVFVLLIIGAVVPCFSVLATIIPIFFPRIALAFRPMFDKNKKEVSQNNE